MADETSTKFRLDLDAEQFMKALGDVKGALTKIGEADNLAGLISSLGELASVAAPVALVLAGIVGTIDEVQKGEQIQKVADQFQALSKNAGMSAGQTEAFKRALVSASGGLATDTEILKSANKAFVEMNGNVEKLPQIMELARKVTKVFGGELTDNFDKLGLAVASGNTRLLRQMGIIVDQKTAFEKYAASIGMTVSQLTEMDKKQAILNEVLERGRAGLDAASKAGETSVNSWKKFKVAIDEAGEAIAIFFNQKFGPSVRKAVGWIADLSHEFKNFVVGTVGEGTAKAEANLERLESSIVAVKKRIEEIRKLPQGTLAGELAAQEQALKKYEHQLDIVKASEEDRRRAERLSTKTTISDSAAIEAARQRELDKSRNQLEHEKEFASEAHRVATDRQKTAEASIELARTEQKLNEAVKKQKNAIFADESAQIREITAKERLKEMSAAEASAKRAAIHAQTAAKIKTIDSQELDRRVKMDQEIVKSSKSAFGSIEASARLKADQTTKSWQESGKLAGAAVNSFSSHAKSAFMDLGKGTKDASDIMKGFFFGMLGDMAEQEGEFLLLSSIWPPNPVGLAAGGALLALGGFLQSQAGGSSTSSGGGGYGAGGDVGSGVSAAPSPTDFTAQPAASTAQASQAQGKAVVINVQGHYFQTEETQRQLQEIIRQYQDATDFTFRQIGHP